MVPGALRTSLWLACGVTGIGISEPEGSELPGAGGEGPGVRAVVLSRFALFVKVSSLLLLCPVPVLHWTL